MSVDSVQTLERVAGMKITLRKPPYTFLHIRVHEIRTWSTQTKSVSQLGPLDELTLRSHLIAALQQYLGLTGAAIPIDILKVDADKNEAWIRLPSGDESAAVAALSQWTNPARTTSLRIMARGSWLGGMVGNPNSDDSIWTLEKSR